MEKECKKKWDLFWFVKYIDGKEYTILKNHDGKHWILSSENINVGIQLYQPTTLKGKIIKIFYLSLGRSKIVNRILNIDVCGIKFQLPVMDIGLKYFDTIDYLAIYYIDSEIESNKKITVQYSYGKQILGYIKFSDSSVVAEAFEHEANILKKLNQVAVSNIPKCLAYSQEEKYSFFVQTTQKTIRAKCVTRLSAKHWDFLEEMYNKTKVEKSYKESYEYELILDLYKKLESRKDYDVDGLINSIELVNLYFSEKVSWLCCGHNDFTPWNTYYIDHQLYVFDFEYAQMNCMPYLDVFHFWMQPLILDEHLSAREIIERVKSDKLAQNNYFENFFYSMQLYILKMIAFHYRRNKGDFDWNDQCFVVWRELLLINIKI